MIYLLIHLPMRLCPLKKLVDLNVRVCIKSRNHSHLVEGCFSGSIFVTEEARKYFRGRWFPIQSLLRSFLTTSSEKLQGSRFYDDVPTITECFDQSTKLQFRDKTELSYVKFGGLRDREPSLNIQRGLLAIEGWVQRLYTYPRRN